MRIFLFLLLSTLLMLGGYWVFAAQMIERQVAAQIAASPQLAGSPRSVTGFPLAFRQVIESPQWRSRDQQTGWRGPDLILHAPSYQPNRITAHFPRSQLLRLGTQETTLDTAAMTGLLIIRPDQHLRAAHLQVDTATLNPAVLLDGAQAIQISLEQVSGQRYDVQLQADALRLAPELLRMIDPDMALDGGLVEHLAVTATADFSGPLALGTAWPDLMAAELSDARLDWGALQIAATGQVARGTSGQLDGDTTLQVEDWRPLLAQLERHEVLPPDAAMMAGMFFAAQSDPGTNRLTLPLVLRDSVLSLGPFALFRLPAF